MWTFSAGVGVEVFLFPVAAMCRLPSGKSGQMRPEHLVATDVPAPCHFKMRKPEKETSSLLSLWLILIWNWEKTHNSVLSGRHYFFEGICVQLDSMKYANRDCYRFEPKQRVLSFLAHKKYMICLGRVQCLETSAFHQCFYTNFSC